MQRAGAFILQGLCEMPMTGRGALLRACPPPRGTLMRAESGVPPPRTSSGDIADYGGLSELMTTYVILSRVKSANGLLLLLLGFLCLLVRLCLHKHPCRLSVP